MIGVWDRLVILAERPLDGHSGAQGRIDFSGARGGVRRPPISKNVDFPYDMPVTLGLPSSARGDASNGGLRKYVPDDGEHISDVGEARATPMNFGMSGRSNLVQSPPGASGPWANAPGDDDDGSEPGKNVRYTRGHDVEEAETHAPHVRDQTDDELNSHIRDQTDDELENRMNRIWGREDNENFVQEEGVLGAIDAPGSGEDCEEPPDVRADQPLVKRHPSVGAPPLNFSFIGKKMSSRGNYGMHGEGKMDGLTILTEVLDTILNEVKKKKDQATVPRSDGHSYSPALDFSAPLGAYNLYRSQGASNWGPMTGPGTQIDLSVNGKRSSKKMKNETARDVVFETGWDAAHFIAEAVATKEQKK